MKIHRNAKEHTSTRAVLQTVDHHAYCLVHRIMLEVCVGTANRTVIAEHGLHHVHCVEREEVCTRGDRGHRGVHFMPLSGTLDPEERGSDARCDIRRVRDTHKMSPGSATTR